MNQGFNAWHLQWNPLGGVWGAVGIGVLFILALWGGWRSLRALESKAKRRVLFLLRFLALLSVFAALLRPQIEWQRTQKIPGALAVLVDQSASMALPGGPGKSRAQMVQDALTKGRGDLEALARDYEINYFSFSDSLQQKTIEELLSPKAISQAPRTDLSAALQALRRHYEEGATSLSGVLLFSDGADRGTLGSRLALQAQKKEKLVDFPAPLYTFAPGDDRYFKDVRIGAVHADEFGFVKTPLSVSVEIEMEGLSDRTVPVTLSEGKDILGVVRVDLSDKKPVAVAEFRFSPPQLGSHIYTLKIPDYAEDLLRENNQHSFEVRVIRDKIRILHVAGHPSWDEKFLRLAMRSDPNIDLIAFYILRTREDLLYDSDQSDLSLIPFPHQELFGPELPTFDLVIFQDFDYRKFFPPVYLENVRQYVMKGGAFMMLGGESSFAGGLYAETPLAEILPLQMPAGFMPMMQKNFSMSLTPAGLRHPVTRLHPDDALNRQLWQKMPVLKGLNEQQAMLPGAVVLGIAGEHGSPLLSVRETGKGRTLALATDSSWQWSFHRVRDGGTAEAYQTFFKNAIRWLIGDPTESLVDVETSPADLFTGDTVQIAVRARDRSYQLNAKAKVSLAVETPLKNLEFQGTTNDLGGFSQSLVLQEAGFYKARATVVTPGGGLAVGEAVFAVEGAQGEWQFPRMNPELLKHLAQDTGGRFEVLPHKLEVSGKQRLEEKVLDRKTTPVWNTAAFLGVVAGLLIVEWAVRRRAGLL